MRHLEISLVALGALGTLGALALSLGCGNRNNGGASGTGVSTLTLGSTGTEATTNDSGPDKFDVQMGTGTGNSGGEGGDDACQKVDLLFVIDNSGSMFDEQLNLVSSFPGFISSIQTELAETMGYHVGVTTSDLYFAFDCFEEGALVTRTAGADSSNATCTPYATGANYMDETDDLATKFACAAQVGTAGDGNERPMQTMMKAISPALNGVGGCNEGFIRDDALLVIVIITDEEDDQETDSTCTLPQSGSTGDPATWFNTVVGIKGSVESNVVVLALVGPSGADQCPAIDKCNGGIDGAEVGTRLLEFANMFTYGFVGPVCAPSYDSFLQEAVSLIDSACDDFMPPG